MDVRVCQDKGEKERGSIPVVKFPDEFVYSARMRLLLATRA